MKENEKLNEFENEFDKELADLISLEVDQILREIAQEDEKEPVDPPMEEPTESAPDAPDQPEPVAEPESPEDDWEEPAEEPSAEPTEELSEELTEEAVEQARMQALQELYPDEPADEMEKPMKVPVKAIVLGVAAAMVLMVTALLVGFGMYVSNRDTIYPKVSVLDVKLGGMTVEQAEQALLSADVGDPEQTAITLEMPGGQLELTFADVGLDQSAQEIAQYAYEYGRQGGTVKKTLRFLKSAVFSTDLTGRILDTPSKGYVEALLENAVIEAEVALNADVVLDTEAQTLTLIKGAQNIRLVRSDMLKLVMDAIEDREYGKLTYQPKTAVNDKEEVALLREQFCAEARDAYYDKETGEVVPEVIGVEFDDAAVMRQWKEAEVGEKVSLDVTVTMPEETEAHLKEVLFSTELAVSVTSLRNSGSNRNNNIRIATEKLNGLVLMPGERLSYNNLLGKRTPENGYLKANAYIGGEVVQEYGGGICQVSSALYYCALLSQLQIDERTNHTFRVNYVPLSYDATVSWGGPDFIFTNSRDYPIRINASMTSTELTVTITGTDNGKYVKLTNTSSYAYTNPEYPDVATGIYSEATRWVYDSATNALLSKERMGTDLYQYHEEEIQYPSPTPEPTPSPSPTPVITPSPTPEVTPTPTPTPSPTPSPEVTPSPEPPPSGGEETGISGGGNP